MRTTVLVITWRGREHLGACLDALAAQDRAHRTLVVDNASDDGTAELLAKRPVEVLRLPRNLGYAGGIAAALERVSTPFVAWLNDDAAPESGWLAALEDMLDAAPGAAAAASHLLTPTGATQSLGVALTADGHGRDAGALRPFGFCGGAALLRVDPLLLVGGVPGEFFCYYEDTDTSWRLRLAGYDVITVPGARVLHRHGASTRPGSRRFHRWNERNRLLMLLRCAPATIALRELARFMAVTLAIPLRRNHGSRAANHTLALRFGVMRQLLAMLPRALAARRAIDVAASVPSKDLWRAWAGTPDLPATIPEG